MQLSSVLSSFPLRIVPVMHFLKHVSVRECTAVVEKRYVLAKPKMPKLFFYVFFIFTRLSLRSYRRYGAAYLRVGERIENREGSMYVLDWRRDFWSSLESACRISALSFSFSVLRSKLLRLMSDILGRLYLPSLRRCTVARGVDSEKYL